MLLLLLLLLIALQKTVDSFTNYAIDVFSTFQHFITPSSIDLSYTPAALPLSPLLQPNFDDLRNYAIAVSEILKNDVDVAKNIITNDAVIVVEEIRDAALPDSGDQLFGVVIGEATAGFISGIASRAVAKLLNDEKRDTQISKGISTGTFFGTRGLIRGAAQLAGIPRPIARILASIGATAFSESAKVAQRAAITSENEDDNENVLNNKDKKSALPLMSQLNKKVYGSNKAKDRVITNKAKVITNKAEVITNKEKIITSEDKNVKKPLISASEITGDVTKWVLYDLLLPFRSFEDSPLPQMIIASAEVGGVAGFGGKVISVLIEKAENKDDTSKNGLNKIDNKLTRQLIFAIIEGATLFAAYEGSISLLDVGILPSAPEFLQKIIEQRWF